MTAKGACCEPQVSDLKPKYDWFKTYFQTLDHIICILHKSTSTFNFTSHDNTEGDTFRHEMHAQLPFQAPSQGRAAERIIGSRDIL